MNGADYMENKILTSILRRTAEEGFARKMGLRTLALHPGHAVVEMTPSEADTNIFGMVHGGAIFSLMDEAFQLSCNSHGTVALALSVHVVYHSPPDNRGSLRAESTEIHRSRKTATYEIRVMDEKGALIASCQATAYRKSEKLPFLEEG